MSTISLADAVRAHLDAHRGQPQLPAEIAAATGLAERGVRRALGQLVRDGVARRAGGGRFVRAGRRDR